MYHIIITTNKKASKSHGTNEGPGNQSKNNKPSPWSCPCQLLSHKEVVPLRCGLHGKQPSMVYARRSWRQLWLVRPWQPLATGELGGMLYCWWGRQQMTLQGTNMSPLPTKRSYSNHPFSGANCQFPAYQSLEKHPPTQSHSHFPPWFLQIGVQLTQDLPDKKKRSNFWPTPQPTNEEKGYAGYAHSYMPCQNIQKSCTQEVSLKTHAHTSLMGFKTNVLACNHWAPCPCCFHIPQLNFTEYQPCNTVLESCGTISRSDFDLPNISKLTFWEKFRYQRTRMFNASSDFLLVFFVKAEGFCEHLSKKTSHRLTLIVL